MKTKFSLLLMIVALLSLLSLQTRGDTIALSFGGMGGGSGTTQNVTVGWSFSLNSNISVTQLGAFDANNSMPLSGPPDGLLSDQLITLWTSTGTFITSATVPAGGGTLANGFRYVSIPQTFLTAGNSYVISDYYSPTNQDPNVEFFSTVTTAPGVMYGDAREGSTTGNVFPDFVLSGTGVWGPNFQFVAATNGVPESGSAWILMASSLGGIVLLRSTLQRRIH